MAARRGEKGNRRDDVTLAANRISEKLAYVFVGPAIILGATAVGLIVVVLQHLGTLEYPVALTSVLIQVILASGALAGLMAVAGERVRVEASTELTRLGMSMAMRRREAKRLEQSPVVCQDWSPLRRCIGMEGKSRRWRIVPDLPLEGDTVEMIRAAMSWGEGKS